jgi:hypothetical protein
MKFCVILRRIPRILKFLAQPRLCARVISLSLLINTSCALLIWMIPSSAWIVGRKSAILLQYFISLKEWKPFQTSCEYFSNTMKCISGFKYCRMRFEGLKITSNFPGNFKDGGYLNTINCSEVNTFLYTVCCYNEIIMRSLSKCSVLLIICCSCCFVMAV